VFEKNIQLTNLRLYIIIALLICIPISICERAVIMADKTNELSKREKVKINGNTTLVPYEDNLYKVDKLFFSPIKEEEWLNLMAANGYAFEKRVFAGYIFSKDKQASGRYYSVVILPAPMESEVSQKLVNERADVQGIPFYSYANKAYYITQKQKNSSYDGVLLAATTKRCHLRRVFLVHAAFLCFWLALLCYNLTYWIRLDSASATVTDKNGALWNYTIDMSGIFGNYPTTPYISLFIVLTLAFVPLTVYFLDQFLYSRRFEKGLAEKCAKK